MRKSYANLLQWKSEIGKFIKGKPKVVVITNITSWENTTVRQFKEADFIIVSTSVLDHERYLHNVAKLAGVVELADSKQNTNRAKRDWRKAANESIMGAMPELLANKQEFAKNLKAKYDDSVESCRQNVAPIPSKRFVGVNYAKNKQAELIPATSNKKRKHGDPPENGEPATRDDYFKGIMTESMLDWKVIFDMFTFARMAVDEYTYLDQFDESLSFVKARSRWILSGTPDLATCSDIFKIGKLLNAHVGSDDFYTMSAEQWDQVNGDMTRTYLQQSLLYPFS